MTDELTDEQVAEARDRLYKMQDELLEARTPKKGFRKLSTKEIKKLEEQVIKLANDLAQRFLSKYTPLCTLYGIEVRAVMKVNPYQPNVAQAVTELSAYRPQALPKVKPWHEAMADNLHTRANCEHVLHEEGNTCEKCGLAPENWGASGKGVTPEYHQKMEAKIKETKEQHEADERGEEEKE